MINSTFLSVQAVNSGSNSRVQIQNTDSLTKLNDNISFTYSNLTNTYLNQSNLQNGYPQSWTSTSIYNGNGFFTVGGDGVIFYAKNTFTAPSILTKLGFYTGSAWDGKNFLAVGDHYGPSEGVLMDQYNPSSNSLTDISYFFPPSLDMNARLFQTVWNGTDFIIIGSYTDNTVQNTGMLYSFNPSTNSLDNLTNLLPPSFSIITSASMVATPIGVFILTQGLNGVNLGLLANNNINDLTSYLPSASTMIIGEQSYLGFNNARNLMVYNNGNLYIGLSSTSNIVSFYSFNYQNRNLTAYDNLFTGVNGVVTDVLQIQNYYFIGGYLNTSQEPFLYAIKPGNSTINVLNSIPAFFAPNNKIMSMATDGKSQIFVTSQNSPVKYGMITVNLPQNPTSTGETITISSTPGLELFTVMIGVLVISSLRLFNKKRKI